MRGLGAVTIFGATLAEARMALPGAELIGAPLLQVTHAATIDATPEQVWALGRRRAAQSAPLAPSSA